MFGWFRRRKKDVARRDTGDAPAGASWATFLTREQELRFERLVDDWFRGRGLDFQLQAGLVVCGANRYGLENLAQRCRPLPADEWALCIDDYFATIFDRVDEARAWEATSSDFAAAAPTLKLRIWPSDMVAVHEDWLVREELPGTVSAVVADLPTAVTLVPATFLATWSKTADELFALALAQTLREYPVAWETLPDDAGGHPLHVASADHLFVCSHVFGLDCRPEVLAPDGCLVAIPDRGTMLVLPLRGSGLAAAVGRMAGLAHVRHRRGPGSTSPHLYWRRADGTFELQRCTLVDGALQFMATDGLLAVFDRMG